jgi:hypothetical protein
MGRILVVKSNGVEVTRSFLFWYHHSCSLGHTRLRRRYLLLPLVSISQRNFTRLHEVIRSDGLAHELLSISHIRCKVAVFSLSTSSCSFLRSYYFE